MRWVLTTPSQPGSDGVTFFSSLPFSIVADDWTQTKRGGRSNRATTGPTYTVLYGGYHLIRGHNIYSLMDKAPRSVIKTRVRARRVPRVCRACRRACSVCGAGERGGLSSTLLECKVQLKAARLELGLGPVHRVDLKFLRRLPTPGGIWAVGGLHTVITLSSRSHQAPQYQRNHQPRRRFAASRRVSRVTLAS